MEVRFRGRNDNHICYYCQKPITRNMVTNYYEIVACRLPVGEEAHSKCYAAQSAKDCTESKEKIEEMERMKNLFDSRNNVRRSPDEMANQ